MGKGSLLFVPSGGLANRMRAIASAVNLSRHTGVRVRVLWFQDWALHAPFGSIFESVSGLELREARWADRLLYDRPRRRNMRLPRVAQALLFGQRIDEWQVTPLKQRGFDFEAWAEGKNSWMSCYQVFGTPGDQLYAELFRPVGVVMAKVDEVCARFSPHTVGFHIRRTDHAESIAASPIRLFIEAGKREIDAHDDTRIYLATDDEATKAALRQQFGDRVLASPSPASRSSIEGIRGGLADMYTLARTRVIYGSAGSSFSPMAARVGGARLVVLQSDPNQSPLK